MLQLQWLDCLATNCVTNRVSKGVKDNLLTSCSDYSDWQGRKIHVTPMAFSCFVNYPFGVAGCTERGSHLRDTPRITKNCFLCQAMPMMMCGALRRNEATRRESLHHSKTTYTMWHSRYWFLNYSRAMTARALSGCILSPGDIDPKWCVILWKGIGDSCCDFSCCWDGVFQWGHASHSADNSIKTFTKRPGMTSVYPQHVYIGLSPFRAIVANEGL